MIARSGLEKLIVALLEIYRRRARDVIEKIVLAIPRHRWTHRCPLSRMIEVVRTREVLCARERRCGFAEVRRVIVNKCTATLKHCYACKRDAPPRHRHNG